MKIAVAMSGGIDSTIAAILLKEQGHEILGITAKILLCADMDGAEPHFDVCCSPENINDAKNIARKYNFPHIVSNLEDDFDAKVIQPFCKEYLQGRTPSPCIHCNARIKFTKLIERAQSMGYNRLATGHYAQIHHTDEGRYYVSAGLDPDKDQSYFLFSLSQDILQHVLFPLGGLHKKEIRKMALDMNLSIADKPESQEICFVLDNDYPSYIERKTGIIPPEGSIITTDGNVLGRHKGIHRYTIGQRRGLGISAPHPLYVIDIDAQQNTIIVGRKDALQKRGLIAKNITYAKVTSLRQRKVFVKTRSTQKIFPAQLTEKNGSIIVDFLEPQQQISPGQAVVFYDKEHKILAGGWIESSF